MGFVDIPECIQGSSFIKDSLTAESYFSINILAVRLSLFAESTF